MVVMSSLLIEIFSAERLHSSLAELVALFEDAVESGASVGFVLPLEPGEALRYWEGVKTKISSGDLILLVAWQDSRIVGSVQLCLEKRPNGRHRAEVVKLLVHRSARRRGIGQALMQAVEKAALDEGRTLLVLDTRRGDDADQLYRKIGYVPAGIIPRYALSSTRSLEDTVFFYKELIR